MSLKTILFFIFLFGVGIFFKFNSIEAKCGSQETKKMASSIPENDLFHLMNPVLEIITFPAVLAESSPALTPYVCFDLSHQQSFQEEVLQSPASQAMYVESSLDNRMTSYHLSEPLYSSHFIKESSNSNKSYLRIDTGAVFGNFIGLKENYGEVGIFASPGFYDNWYPFADLHGYHFKEGLWGASAGVGLRFWDRCNERVWGFNVFYDYRDTCLKDDRGCDCSCDINESHWNCFNRIGVGFESLGCFDLRMNGYFPVGSNSHKGRTVYFNDYEDGYFATLKKKEFIYYGFDAEIGTRTLLFCDFWFYGAAGTYFYSHRDLKEFWGGQARVELNWKDMLSLQARYSYDDVFHSEIQGRVLISFPLDYFTCCGSSCFELCQTFWNQSVLRNPVPFVREKCCWKWNW